MSSGARLYMDFMTSHVGGEAADREYLGQIELTSWDWDFKRNKEKTEDSSDSEAGRKAEPSVLRFSKSMDKSSPQLLRREI
jgi:type VI protein secretion system component Hcp